MPECIQERRRTQGFQVVTDVWHIVAGPANEEATWRPILCGEGIVFPGPSQDREATCDACVMRDVARRAAPPNKQEDADD